MPLLSHNRFIEVNHVGMNVNPEVNHTVRAWLSSADPSIRGALQRLPLGYQQRDALNGATFAPPFSERNAYVGSAVRPDGMSRGAGLNPDAIVKLETSAPNTPAYGTNPVTYGSLPGEVGVKEVALTGMIRKQDIASARFTVRTGRSTVAILHDLGALNHRDMRIPDALFVAAAPGDYLPYRITATIGRGYDGLTGPDGRINGLTHSVWYELAGVPGPIGRSPGSTVLTQPFVLPPPVKGGPDNLTMTLTGAVEAEHVRSPFQLVRVRLYAEDSGRDPQLGGDLVRLPHDDPRIWDGLLLPYSLTVQLYVDEDGFVYGPLGTSGQRRPRVYQVVELPGRFDLSSDPIEVP